MSLKVMAVVDARLTVLEDPGKSGRSVTEVCRLYQISRDTFYAWQRAYLAEGLAGLEPGNRRPNRSPRRVPLELEDLILSLRNQHKWGPRKIRDALTRHADGKPTDDPADPAPGLPPWQPQWAVPAISTVQQVLARNGTLSLRPKRSRPPGGGRSFERPASNDLWQIDGTLRHLSDGTPYWVVDIVDDHSRYCLSALAGPSLTGQLAWTALRGAIELFGLPGQLLSDNGLCFTGRLHGLVVSFERQVMQAGVTFLHSRPYHPQTCGKVERLHATCQQYLQHHHQPPATLTQAQQQLDAFRTHYNTIRPHQALDGAAPADRYRPGTGTLLPIVELPPADHNPTGSLRRLVTDRGTISYAGHRVILGTRWAGVSVGVLRERGNAHIYYGQSLISTIFIGTNAPTPTR